MLRSLRLGSVLWALLLAAPLSVSEATDCLFVTHDGISHDVSAFQVQADGSLVFVPGSPFSGGGAGAAGLFGDLGLAVKGGVLFVPNLISDDVSALRIAEDCALAPVAGSPFSAGDGPAGVIAHPVLDLLFVANVFDDTLGVFPDRGGRLSVAGRRLSLRHRRRPP